MPMDQARTLSTCIVSHQAFHLALHLTMHARRHYATCSRRLLTRDCKAGSRQQSGSQRGSRARTHELHQHWHCRSAFSPELQLLACPAWQHLHLLLNLDCD